MYASLKGIELKDQASRYVDSIFSSQDKRYCSWQLELMKIISLVREVTFTSQMSYRLKKCQERIKENVVNILIQSKEKKKSKAVRKKSFTDFIAERKQN